jgi:hypothetical protein
MSDLSLPPDYIPTLPAGSDRERSMVKLAREIAMDLRPLDDILELHGISRGEFERIKVNPYFTRVLTAEKEVWEAASNTRQRVEMKAAAIVEEFLPELYRRMVNPKEDLLKVVKGLEHASRLAKMGNEKIDSVDMADKVVITINMGADARLEMTKQVPAKVIDHDADELQQNVFDLSLETAGQNGNQD